GEVTRVGAGDGPAVGRVRGDQGVGAAAAVDGHGGLGKRVLDVDGVVAAAGVEGQGFGGEIGEGRHAAAGDVRRGDRVGLAGGGAQVVEVDHVRAGPTVEGQVPLEVAQLARAGRHVQHVVAVDGVHPGRHARGRAVHVDEVVALAGD